MDQEKSKPAESTRERIKQSLHLGRTLRVVWESGPGWTLAGVALILVQSLMPLALLYLLKLIIDAVTIGAGGADRTRAFGHILFLISLAGAGTLIMVLCRSLADLVKEAQSRVVTDHVSDLIHAKSVEVDLAYYENPAYHDTLYRAQEEAPWRPTSIVSGLMQLGQNTITFIGMAGLLFAFHWGAALIIGLACLPGVLIRIKFAGKMFSWQQDSTAMERRAWYYHEILTNSTFAKEIRLFGLGPHFMDWFRDLRKQLREARLRIQRSRSLFELIGQASATIAIFGLLALIAYKTLYGAITLGSMVMYYQAFQRAQASLQEMLTGIAGLYEDNLFISNFYEFLDLKPDLIVPAQTISFPRPIARGIDFRGVNFSYPGAIRPALKDISLTVAPGSVVALVGENGSGKTTLIKLLCRFYDPSGGRIAIDGKDLREIDLDSLRGGISVIFQDYVRYNLSAKDNIRLGHIKNQSLNGNIAEAARRTGAHEFIERLPHGYDTILGNWFEAGSELSLGEWQKIALARAFLREADLVVLDEPTSSMDAKAEYQVFAAFRELLNGRTGVLISHRFSTVRLADYIYVLDKGTIREKGTHEELLRAGGQYATLFNMQAESYR
jgi:ATP-binding cassette, subfamily B, bacterial